MDRSRDGKYLAAQLCRQFGGDERATALCGLNDEGALAEGGDQAVAHGKMKGTRPLVEGILTQQQSLRGDLMGQLAISSRIDNVHPRGQYRDGARSEERRVGKESRDRGAPWRES